MPDDGMGGLIAVGARTVILLLALAVGVRLFGRRQLGEMNARDLLMVLLVANAVQNAMTKGDGQLSVALVAAGVLLLIGWLLSYVSFHHPALDRYLKGTPLVIVSDGQLARANMKRARISVEELMAQVRKQGLPSIDGVALAVAEVDGSVSVVPKNDEEAAGGGG